MLVSHDPDRDFIHVFEASITNSGDIKAKDNRHLKRDSYTLDLIFAAYQAADFDVYQIPSDEYSTTRRAFVLKHSTVTICFNELAAL